MVNRGDLWVGICFLCSGIPIEVVVSDFLKLMATFVVSFESADDRTKRSDEVQGEARMWGLRTGRCTYTELPLKGFVANHIGLGLIGCLLHIFVVAVDVEV